MLCSLDCLLKTSTGHHETGAWIPRRTYHYVVTKSFPFPTKRKLKILLSFLLPFLSFNDVFLALKFKTLALKTTSLSARDSHFVENGYPHDSFSFTTQLPLKTFKNMLRVMLRLNAQVPQYTTNLRSGVMFFSFFFLLLCFFGSRGKKMMRDKGLKGRGHDLRLIYRFTQG